MSIGDRLKALTSTNRGRYMLGGGAAALLALVMLARRGGGAAAPAVPGGLTSGPPALVAIDPATGQPMSTGGQLYGGGVQYVPAPTVDDTSAQTFNERIGDLGAEVFSLRGLIEELRMGGVSGGAAPAAPAPVYEAPPADSGPAPAAPAPPPARTPVPPRPTFNPGFFRSGGANTPVQFRNAQGSTAVANHLDQAQRDAIVRATQAARATRKPVSFSIPGTGGAYLMQPGGAFRES